MFAPDAISSTSRQRNLLLSDPQNGFDRSALGAGDFRAQRVVASGVEDRWTDAALGEDKVISTPSTLCLNRGVLTSVFPLVSSTRAKEAEIAGTIC